MTIDLTKPLMIVGFGPVRLLTSEGREKAYPLVVESERGVLWKFAVDGRSYSPHSLINAPEPPLVRWLLVDGFWSHAFGEERHARDALRGHPDGRLFRIEIGEQPKIEEVK